jgi:hypothetical protein
MIRKKDANTITFSMKGKIYELFAAKDGFIELYEGKNPGKTGFLFQNKQDLTMMVNLLTDILEQNMLEEKNEIK